MKTRFIFVLALFFLAIRHTSSWAAEDPLTDGGASFYYSPSKTQTTLTVNNSSSLVTVGGYTGNFKNGSYVIMEYGLADLSIGSYFLRTTLPNGITYYSSSSNAPFSIYAKEGNGIVEGNDVFDIPNAQIVTSADSPYVFDGLPSWSSELSLIEQVNVDRDIASGSFFDSTTIFGDYVNFAITSDWDYLTVVVRPADIDLIAGISMLENVDFSAVQIITAPIPEPTTISLLGLGLIGFLPLTKKKNRRE